MKKNRILFHALSENYKKIPGSPIAYWVGMELLKAWDSKTFVGSELTTREGMATADNAQFLRYWTEVSYARADFAQCDKKNSLKKWFPYNKGGAFRRWYGNNDYLVNWENNGTAIKSNQDPKTGRIRSHNYNGDFAFCEGITWSAISSNQIAVRYSPAGFLWDSKGAMGFGGNLLFYLGLLNSIVSEDILKILSPTLDFKVGDIAKIPLLEIDRSVVKSIVATLIDLSRSDWDEYETSWDFKVDPLVREGWQRNGSPMSLEAAWTAVFKRRMEWTTRMKELEEENNRLFIKAYGLEGELRPDVAWKDVSLKGNPYYRYGEVKIEGENLIIEGGMIDYVDENLKSTALDGARKGEMLCVGSLKAKALADAMRELLSYGMGVLMGRYSLEQEGLILASQGETYKDYIERVHGAGKILPDDDGIIPAIALDGSIFQDNLLHRMREFLSAAFGNDALPSNLNFIEEALGCGFDKYLTDKFFDDHAKTYRKRPIYWLFESPKGYFRAFAYMHRMTGATAGLIRNKYLLSYIEHLERTFVAESAKGAAMNSTERRRVKEIEKAIADCKAYDLALHDIAEKSIAIDLDDGVVANWAKYKSVLAKI